MFRKQLTFANVMSVVAVFIALGGSAVALRANSVGSRQIKDDSVKGRDIADGKVKGKDLAERAIGPRGLKPSAIDLWPFTKLSDDIGSCDPSSSAFVPCATVTLATQWPSRALLFAGGGQEGNPSPDAAAIGSCKFRINGSTDLLSSAAPLIGDAGSRNSDRNGFGFTATSDPAELIPPGSNTFEIVCNEVSGDVRFSHTFSVLTVGGAGFG